MASAPRRETCYVSFGARAKTLAPGRGRAAHRNAERQVLMAALVCRTLSEASHFAWNSAEAVKLVISRPILGAAIDLKRLFQLAEQRKADLAAILGQLGAPTIRPAAA